MTRWIVGVIVVAVAAIGVIVVVASGSESEPEAAAAFGPDAEAMTEFRDCMSEHGAELPEPPSGGELPAPPSGAPPSGDPPSFDQQAVPPPAASGRRRARRRRRRWRHAPTCFPRGPAASSSPSTLRRFLGAASGALTAARFDLEVGIDDPKGSR